MYIEKVQIEEGFLDGLDRELNPGLNVIIGARGTGKTSLIELIRYCLGVPGYTAESNKRTLEHALAVLRGGQVTVTLRDGDNRIVVSRSADQPEPTASAPFRKPLIFSQSEIEAIGLEAAGRLRLVDSFVKGSERIDDDEASYVSTIRSLIVEAANVSRDMVEHEVRVLALPEIDKKLKELAPEEAKVTKVSADAAKKAKQLEALATQSSVLAVNADYFSRFRDGIERWETAIRTAISAFPVGESWTDEQRPDPLLEVRNRTKQVANFLESAIDELGVANSTTGEFEQKTIVKKTKLEEQSRKLRREIEKLQEGAGAIARQGQKLREDKAQLEALRQVIREKRKTLTEILNKQSEALQKLEEVRSQRFKLRTDAAKKLSDLLAPRIRIDVSQAGQVDKYAAALVDALHGSGLKYNVLAPSLASVVSPRELLEMTFADDAEALADGASIPKDRAMRVISCLREADLGEIATVLVEDEVSLQLLDGGDYKDFSDLSTGQRCTVVLPLILEHKERILIIDQPEDHIDNAFITDTLITAILRRSNEGQMILTTHNANIPVLGDAHRVFHMGSDGRRGFVLTAAALDDQQVVEAISTVMEGGVEAFRRRAEFYKKFDL